ncbi:MAG: hypothetical protein EOP45_13550 [Sphingobacteriaceae bacterium]|nr:MAG: hypothetical protein EOP45_13550 [Sphingobacteriaceae bacterium]
MTQKNGIKKSSRPILDLIIANIPVSVKHYDPSIISEDEPHPALRIECECKNIKFLECNKTPKLNFFKANYVQINDDLANVDWHTAFLNKNINEAVDVFYSIIWVGM